MPPINQIISELASRWSIPLEPIPPEPLPELRLGTSPESKDGVGKSLGQRFPPGHLMNEFEVGVTENTNLGEDSLAPCQPQQGFRKRS